MLAVLFYINVSGQTNDQVEYKEPLSLQYILPAEFDLADEGSSIGQNNKH